VSVRPLDTCIHNRWIDDFGELADYLEPNWQAYVGHGNSVEAVARYMLPRFQFVNPVGDYLSTALSDDGRPPGSSADLVAKEVFDGYGARSGLLVLDRGMFVPALANPYLAAALVRAVNDWTIDRWLKKDRRFRGAVLVATHSPEDAADEVRRVGGHPQIAGVLLTVVSGRPLGHPSYWPIFEAAAELDLPIVLHRGIEGIHDAVPMTATGVPTTFAQYMVGAPNAVISQITSLVTAGTFGKFPLRVLVAGIGVAWIPGVLRRLDVEWRAMRRDVPWMPEPPRETFYRHVRVSTYGIERGAKMLPALLDANPALEDVLCYGSGYPSFDTSTPSEVAELVPEGWHEKVFFRNADDLLRRQPVDVRPEPSSAVGGVR
jgi:uncharacterized protein